MGLEATLRQVIEKVRTMDQMVKAIKSQQDAFARAARPKSITEEIDAIAGRRIFYTLSDRIAFTSADDGLRGQPLNFLISQDGPFVATHYPIAAWKPNAPDNASNFGQWSPVSSWPLPAQQNTNMDIINISYEVVDGGSQRNFQNEAIGPALSRPDNLIPLPVPTLFSPNSTIQVFPTYEDIFFSDDPDEATTGGELWFAFPGYRVVNL